MGLVLAYKLRNQEIVRHRWDLRFIIPNPHDRCDIWGSSGFTGHTARYWLDPRCPDSWFHVLSITSQHKGDVLGSVHSDLLTDLLYPCLPWVPLHQRLPPTKLVSPPSCSAVAPVWQPHCLLSQVYASLLSVSHTGVCLVVSPSASTLAMSSPSQFVVFHHLQPLPSCLCLQIQPRPLHLPPMG